MSQALQNIQFTGNKMQITSALQEYATDKLQRLSRHAENITSLHVTFEVDKLRQIAEANLHIPGAEINAKAESEDMYNAVITLVEKLIRQIDKHREKLTDHHRD